MKAAVLTGVRQLEVQDVPTPEPAAGALLLKVLACGVCGSDIRTFNNGHARVRYPAIMGHEIAAEVVAAGPDAAGFSVGDRVSLGADVPCGRCEWCRQGLGNCCQENYAVGYQYPGGFAEYCLLEPNVVAQGPIRRLPAGLDMEQAALAEPLACCLNGLERVHFAPGRSVVIIGAGPMGISLAKAARALGSPLIVLCDLDAGRLAAARVACADHYLDTGAGDIQAQVLEVTAGRGADVVFTACASPEAQEDAPGLAAVRGAVNFFGGLPAGARLIQISSNLVHYRELMLTGSHGSTPRQHRLALDLIASGRVELSGVISHRFGLDEIHEAFAVAEERRGLKVLVKPHG
ncbi:MAG: alcohol dehydrogenase catalytic domain-containing protein [Candidatus Promineifilaceae bacterium]